MSIPKLLVIASPSGGGKTSIIKALLQRHPEFQFSVSATTRAMRPGETSAKDYFFLTKERFEELIAAGDLVEHEQLYGNYYGTLKSETDRALDAGQSMFFDIDVRGALSIKRMYGAQAVLIFIAPPGLDVLEARLRGRGTEDAATVARRMERAAMEMELGKQFDHIVVNEDLAKAVDDVDGIIMNHLSQ
jgi:guanylate kinase